MVAMSDEAAPAAPAAPEGSKPKSKSKKAKKERQVRAQIEIQKTKKERRRKGFLWGLLVGQIIILIVIFGSRTALFFLKDRVQFNPPIPLEALVFIGMVSGIVITALLIFFVLGLLGAGYLIGGKKGQKKAGFFTSVGRGIKRCFSAAGAIGVTLGVIGGTAWLLIPTDEREHTIDYLKIKGEDAYGTSKAWAEEKFGLDGSEEEDVEINVEESIPIPEPPKAKLDPVPAAPSDVPSKRY